ncbi:hypothetical protein BDV93DRAFT_510968 [Ceratobasidium sp. AG-I]|nr:hypothetical protein BDV93DRAFT_510968 [Ceratobasidium sp. AG-I]
MYNTSSRDLLQQGGIPLKSATWTKEFNRCNGAPLYGMDATRNSNEYILLRIPSFISPDRYEYIEELISHEEVSYEWVYDCGNAGSGAGIPASRVRVRVWVPPKCTGNPRAGAGFRRNSRVTSLPHAPSVLLSKNSHGKLALSRTKLASSPVAHPPRAPGLEKKNSKLIWTKPTHCANVTLVNVGLINVGLANVRLANARLASVGLVNVGLTNVGLTNVGLANVKHVVRISNTAGELNMWQDTNWKQSV